MLINTKSLFGPLARAGLGAVVATMFAGAPALAQGDATARAQASSKSIVEVEENGRSFRFEWRDGELSSAQMDGKKIPKDRLKVEGDSIKVLDENGDVLFEQQAPSGGASAGATTWIGQSGSAPEAITLQGVPGGQGHGGNRRFVLRGNHDGENPIAVVEGVPAEPPAVMIGVQMADPAPALAGHFGFDRGKATMVSAVYDTLPAARAGLNPYDLIVGIDGGDSASPNDVRAALKEKKAGDTVSFSVIQKGEKKTLTVTLDAYDAEKLHSAEIRSVDAADNAIAWWSGDASAPRAPVPPLPPGAMPEDVQRQIDRLFQNWRPYVGVAPDGGAKRGFDVFIAPEQGAAAPDGSDSAPGGDDLNRLEDRLDRLERLLERLNEQHRQDRDPQNDRGGHS